MRNEAAKSLPMESLLLDEEKDWLWDHSKGMASIVEIGAFQGHGAALMSLAEPDAAVWTVDDYKTGKFGETWHQLTPIRSIEMASDVRRTLEKYVPNVTLIHETSEEAAKMFYKVDMVFIDADHTAEAVFKDLELWYPRTRVLLCGHDYKNHRYGIYGVEQALERFGKPFKQGPGSIWYMEMQ